MITAAVAGNPNSGKTCLFNNLTGTSQTVGNYAGVTVERIEGIAKVDDTEVNLVDLPGTYSLTAYSMDEVVARRYIIEERPDVIINVIDASNLERNLYLTTQLLEMEVPVVVALNMTDIARKRGYIIDSVLLSRLIGVPVVETVGNKGKGAEELLRTASDIAAQGKVPHPRMVDYGPALEGGLRGMVLAIKEDAALEALHKPRWLALKLLEEDEEVVRRLRLLSQQAEGYMQTARQVAARVEMAQEDDIVSLIAEKRYGFASGLVRECVSLAGPARQTLTDQVDAIVCNRALGFVFVALCVWGVFKATFFCAEDATWIPLWLDGEITWMAPTGAFGYFFDDWLPTLVTGMDEGALKSLLRDGVIGGVGGVMSFVPLIFFMFFFLAVVEDSGYIARIAFVLDRVLRTFGLQGKSIMAMIVSGGIAGGCAVPGVLATRTLREEKDRLTTMMIVPLMNCGAKMPVLMMLIAAFFTQYRTTMLWSLAMLSWAVALCVAWLLRKLVIRAEQTPFVMELPPYHIPHWRGVFMSAARRTWMYMKKAFTIILAAAIVLWALMYFPRLPAERLAPFERAEHDAKIIMQANVSHTVFADDFKGNSLADLNKIYFASEVNGKDGVQIRMGPKGILLSAIDLLSGNGGDKENVDIIYQQTTAISAAREYLTYLNKLKRIEHQKNTAQMEYSLAGRFGKTLEPVTQYAGFDWRTNIALLGGWAAKEVVLSTLGTAYSIGEVDVDAMEDERAGESELALRLRQQWTPLRGFVLMIFIMLYAPCLATLAVIWRESGSWRWAAFATIYTTMMAFVIAVATYQVGGVLGLGGGV